MLRSSLFWRLYVTYTVIVLVTATVTGALIQRQMLSSLGDQIEARLSGEAAALMPVAVDAFTRDSGFEHQATIDAVGATTGSRVTLIALDGQVLADSEQDPERMDNHADRPEFIAAMRSGTGTSRRFSNTLQMFHVYVARAVVAEGRNIGVVRVSIPLAEITATLAGARTQIYRGAAVGIVLALAIGALVARRLTAPIIEMTHVSEALRRGDYDRRVQTGGFNEIRTLGQNLNLLADELTDRLSTLTHQRAQLDAIIRAMQEGVIAIDSDGNVAFSNRSARQLLGLGEDDTQTTGAFKNVDGLPELIAQARTTGTHARHEIQPASSGQEITLDARATPYEADGETGVLLVLYDITNLRRLERVRTDFVANVSHELQTPLTSIRGYVETLIDGAVHDPEHNVRFLDKINQHVRRLSALVSDLLSLARIESPAQTLQLAPVDLRQVVSDSVTRLAEPVAARHLELSLDLGDGPTWVLGEIEGLRQIADNLLDNAISYTPEQGSLRISVKTLATTGELEVTDTGIGIPADALDRIFERFYRVDRGRSRAGGGTGLGLSIVRNLVHKMGGKVTVQSEVGIGSTFTVTFPIAPPA